MENQHHPPGGQVFQRNFCPKLFSSQTSTFVSYYRNKKTLVEKGDTANHGLDIFSEVIFQKVCRNKIGSQSCGDDLKSSQNSEKYPTNALFVFSNAKVCMPHGIHRSTGELGHVTNRN